MDIIGRSYKLISSESFRVELSIMRTLVFERWEATSLHQQQRQQQQQQQEKPR